jgi:hypothetical protein
MITLSRCNLSLIPEFIEVKGQDSLVFVVPTITRKLDEHSVTIAHSFDAEEINEELGS